MHTLTRMHTASISGDWATFVKQHVGTDTQDTVSRRTGIGQPTISRWLRGTHTTPSAPNVVAFARAYGIPPVEALVAAGVITSDEAAVA